MSAELKEHERELISAYADGEVSEDERRAVEILLERDEAKAWLNEVKATSILVKKHATVHAPVGLSGRVMAGLEGEFKPTESGSEASVISAMSWRTPMYAAAAAIIVVVGIMFGPQLIGPGKMPPPASVALDDIPAETGRVPHAEETRENAKPENSKTAGSLKKDDFGENTLDELQEQARHSRRGNPESLKDVGEGGEVEDAKSGSQPGQGGTDKPEDSWGGKPPVEARPAEDKPDGTNADRDSSDRKALGGGAGGRARGSAGDKEDAGSLEKKKKGSKGEERDLEEFDAEEVEKESREEGASNSKEGKLPAADPETDAAEDDNAPKRREDQDGERPVGEPAPTPPSAQAQPKKSEQGSSEGTVELKLSDAAGLAAQNDVLWVSSLYGVAELSEEGDTEIVAIDVDPAKLDELLTALRKLAVDQGYGDVGVVADETERLQKMTDAPAEADVTKGIKGYLPAASGDNQSTGDDTEASIRVVIHLK